MKSTLSLVLLAVSASCFLHSFANAVDWPQWRGANRDGISTEKISPANWGKDGPKQLWKKEVGTGVSSVAVKGGRLYTMGNNGNTDVVFFSTPPLVRKSGNTPTRSRSTPVNLRAVRPARRPLTATRFIR